MEDRRKHIDDLFREGLSDYRETPPADVWSSLEKRLPARDDDQPSKRWIWLLLLLIVGSTAGYFVYKNSLHPENSNSKRQVNAVFNVSQPKSPSLDNSSDHAHKSGQTVPANITATDSRTEERNTIRENTVTSGSLKERKNIASNENIHANSNRADNSSTAKSVFKKTNSVSETNALRKNAGKKTSGVQLNKSFSRAISRTSTTEIHGNNTIEDNSFSSPVVPSSKSSKASNIVSSKKNSTAGETTHTNTNREIKTQSAQLNNQKAGNDNSYLLQPVPEEEDSGEGEETKKSTKNLVHKTKQPAPPEEEEQKQKLHYIPPDESLVPIPPAKTTPDRTTTGTTASTEQGNTKKLSTAQIENNEQFGKPSLSITEATAAKNDIPVNPASFAAQKKKPVKETKFRKGSKIDVQSEIATDPEEKINFIPQQEGSPEINTPASSEIQLALSENASTQKEKNNTPSESGGGSGGGATSYPKNESKFRFDLGIKAGYERGFENLTTNTFIISPYFQWNVSTGFAFVFQPGFRFNQLNSSGFSNVANVYHAITSERIDTAHVYTTDTLQNKFIQRNYIYRNTYDSILVGTRLATKNYWEIELPVMLRYKIASNLAVFGGLSLMFGNLIKTEETRETVASGLQKSSKLSFPKDTSLSSPPSIPPVSGYFSYNTPDIATASSSSNTPATNPARLGLMLGFSYEFQNRIIIDLMYKQTVSDMKFIQNEQIRKIYTQPYVRVMVGVKLFDGEREKAVKKPEGF